MNIWETLQIEETDDISAIKKAYARQSKLYNPEEHMEEFMNIRKAYQQALSLAEGKQEQQQLFMAQQELTQTRQQEQAVFSPIKRDLLLEEKEAVQEYARCEAILQFRTLFFEKKCNDKNLWIRYFTSESFLDVFRKEGFTAQLKAELIETETEIPGGVKKAFFSLLPLVYGLTRFQNKDVLNHGVVGEVNFKGIESIIELWNENRVSINMGDNTSIAISKGYDDYRALFQLTRSGVWNDNVAHSLGKVIGCYVSGYIYDKIPQGGTALYQGDFIPRHQSALQLLNHFFAHVQLPGQAYEILWDKLDLKNAIMGRNKVFYGRLREICLEKVPELETAQKESFAQFRTEASDFFIKFNRGDAGYDHEALEAFFQREDLKRAFRDRTFVEEEIFRWTNYEFWYKILERIIVHCQQDEQVVLREEIIGRIEKTLHTCRVQKALKEDEEASPGDMPVSIENRAFFRYLLYTGFPGAYSYRRSVLLRDSLLHDFPWTLTVSERLLYYDPSTDSIKRPAVFSVQLGKQCLEISLHLCHISFCLDQKPVYAPILPFESIREMEEDLLFWLMLPIAYTTAANQEAVYAEVLGRLKKLDFLKDTPLDLFADCIACQVSQNYEGDFYPSTLIINRERFRVLYTCVIYTDDLFFRIFKTAENGQQIWLYEDVGSDLANAIRLGEHQLDLYLNTFNGETLRDENLPGQMAADIKLRPPVKYVGEEVTLERLKELLLLYRDQKITRLELGWGERVLVLMEAQKHFACFIFDHQKKRRLLYLSRPDLYRTTESQDVIYEKFLYGVLPGYALHATPLSILAEIEDIMNCTFEGRYLTNQMGLEWSQEVYLHNRHQYALDKCLLGGFPIVDPNQYLMEKFVLTEVPKWIRCTSPEDEALEEDGTLTGINGGNRPFVSESLLAFLSGRLTRIKLAWEIPIPTMEESPKPDEEGNPISGSEEEKPVTLVMKRWIELIREGDRYALLYSDIRSENIQILTADVRAYLDHQGKKYKTEKLGGYDIPDCMIHHDLNRIRGYLNVLLASIKSPERILGIFGEFAILPNVKRSQRYGE